MPVLPSHFAISSLPGARLALWTCASLSRTVLIALVMSAGMARQALAQEHEPDPAAPPFIATPVTLAERMLSLANVTPADIVFDLGSGDGRLVIAAAALGARGVGIEYDPALVESSWANAEAAGVRDQVTFLHQDIFESDFREATVVLLYLGPVFNLRIRPALLEQLRPGSRVVSHAFHMGDWEADSVLVLGSGAERASLYSWVIPANVDGFWSLQVEGAPALNLEFIQRFQKLTGLVRGDGRVFSVSDGTLNGAAIEFELVEERADTTLVLELSGRLTDGRLEGIVRGPGPWNGRRWTGVRFSDPSLGPD